MSLRVQVEQGDIHVRVCPGCLHPLEWFEYQIKRKSRKIVSPHSTEERARCPVHGWVDWWRLLHVKHDCLSGFSTIMRGGRLHKRLVRRERALAHARRSLKPQRLSSEARAKLRNRFRGVLVKDSRQMDLFGGVE